MEQIKDFTFLVFKIFEDTDSLKNSSQCIERIFRTCRSKTYDNKSTKADREMEDVTLYMVYNTI